MLKLEQSKLLIDQLHLKLKQGRSLGRKQADLTKIEELLPAKLQEIFKDIPQHGQALEHMNLLNKGYLPVCDLLACYKPELGQLLQQLVESYNLCFLEQFFAYYNEEKRHEQSMEQKNKFFLQQEEAIKRAKVELYAQQDMVRAVLMSKDQEISRLETRLNETISLCQKLQQQIEETKFSPPEDEAIRLQRRAKVMDSIVSSDEEEQVTLDKNDDKQKKAAGNGEEDFKSSLHVMRFEGALDDFAWLKTERHKHLSNINKIVRRLIVRGTSEVACQTDIPIFQTNDFIPPQDLANDR